MQFITSKADSRPSRDFPLYLRPEWRTTYPRLGRLRALDALAGMPDRTPRPLPYHLQVRARQTLAMAAE
ncbi:MAG: hypothetical protein ACJA2X_000862 [Halocynthiibacter sp.]|jgi:hypothetical protein